MSSYATPSDLARLALSASALSGISSSDQQAALDAASVKADSFIGSQFRLPLTTWGDDIRLAVCQIAALYLMQRRGFNPESGHDQSIVMQHDNALIWLRDIARGHIKPTSVTDTTPAASSVSRVSSRTPRGF